MIRIPTLLGLGLLVSGLAVGIVLAGRVQRPTPKASEAAPKPEQTTISNVTDQSFVVTWITSVRSSGFLEVGSSGQPLSRRVLDDRDKNASNPGMYATHYVTVDALQPNATYSFRIGEGVSSLFDKNGTPFSVTTGPKLSINPVSDSAQGSVVASAQIPSPGSIVYAQLPGAQLLSALTSADGNWIIPLSMARTADLSKWAAYDREKTVYALRVEPGIGVRADVTLTTAIDKPVPPIVLGQTVDLRQSKESGSNAPVSLFEFSSLGPVTQAPVGVTLENPKKDGEVVNTDKPEFFGKAPIGTTIQVTIYSSHVVSGKADVAPDGTWRFAPPTSLAPGTHDLTLSWTDPEGILQTFTRSFVVNAAAGGPAFTATSSATPTIKPSLTSAPTSKSPTPKPTTKNQPASPTGGQLTPTIPPRTSVPSGTPPESGSLTPSLFLFMMGSLFTIMGVVLVRRKENL